LLRQALHQGHSHLSLILDFLASGETEAQILAAYPQLQREDIWAATADAAYCRLVPLTAPARS
jgi:hypothetical protein